MQDQRHIVLSLSSRVHHHRQLNRVDHMDGMGSTNAMAPRAAGKLQPHGTFIVLDRIHTGKHDSDHLAQVDSAKARPVDLATPGTTVMIDLFGEPIGVTVATRQQLWSVI